MDKSYRIHTDISSNKVLNVNMKQDFEFLEVLTMKLAQKDAYKIHSSNYGVIIGRVLANDAFGIPNAKVSVFIEKDGTDTTEIENLYPYSEVTSKDKRSIRYNLLPDYSDDECYRIVGTFPNKRLLLDEDTYLEIYDKYWKFSTVTNNAGDYMIFGVPVGSQTIHTDIDLSDIGILSQKPRDFLYKGYTINEFDSASQFKESTNLDSLKQIVSQNKSTYVYPFWGDSDNGIAAITRCDIDVDYKFEPTCIFMGAIVSDNEANAIGHKCAPEVDNGMNNQLIAGEGTIEMIRKTTDGLVEEYPIQGNRLIDSDGVWCYQIPMNLDYIGTDEYGNIVPTDNPNKGIPTRTQVRFRFSKTDTGEEGHSRHTAKYLVPMNPLFYEGDDKNEEINSNPKVVIPKSRVSGQLYENMYTFGSNTPISCFRDLYWNNVYSVKNYIPKTQVAHRAYSTNYSALKGANLVDNQNPIPFNKLRVDLPFMYMIVCIIFTIVMWVVTVINVVLSIIAWMIDLLAIYIPFYGWWKPLEDILDAAGLKFTCIGLGAGVSEDNTAYYPGCWGTAYDKSSCPDEMDNCQKSTSQTDLMDNVQRKLALDFKIIKLDIYQDWINGCLYMPLWYWRKRKKKTFLFGLFSRSASNTFCSCNNSYTRLKTSVTCDIAYEGTNLKTSTDNLLDGEDRWHKAKSATVRYWNGLIKPVINKDGLTAYYYAAMQPTADNSKKKIIDYEANEFNVIRLYATDIILLGNINEDNLYGIPQFFKVLPSTTANIPPISTIEENSTDVKNDTPTKFDALGGEDSGTTVTTGMDWGDKGGDDTPSYKKGLFFDLGCTSVLTRSKSCINVERLSELGVNLDMQYNYAYSRGGNIKEDVIDSDGFISKYELDDLNNRSMFATLNHIGFVPQQYLDEIDSKLVTQVKDENTDYYVPKFRYLFPVDFDGRMQPIMDSYSKGFAQALYDDPDEAYITFRLGADKNGKYGRARHFYKHEGNTWHMPVYNNSYYFYFGINKGSTAIDKFNNLYMADCFQNEKEPFSLDVTVRPLSYCPEMYKCDEEQGYSEIYVSSEDIQIPYSYALYDSYGQLYTSPDGEVAAKNGVTDMSFVLGKEYGFKNQKYKLVVTDDNGKTVKRSVELDMPKMTFQYDSYRLGTKFYTDKTTRMDNICNQESDYFGRFVISNITIDGYDTEIEHVSGSTDDIIINYDEDNDRYNVLFTVKSIDCEKGNEPIIESDVLLTISVLKSNYRGMVRDCMCDLGNKISTKGDLEAAEFYMDNLPNVLTVNNIGEGDEVVWALEFDVFQPNSFSVSLYQICDGKAITANSANEIVAVNNGENFNTYLNEMPLLFMLGSNNDNYNMEVANQSYFYKNGQPAKDARDKSVIGWYGVHQEDTYQFNRPSLMAVEENRLIWEDFLKFNDSFISPLSKLKILQYKFSHIFNLSASIYNLDGSNRLFYTSTGGVQPIIIRSVLPDYENSLLQYVFDEKNYIDVPKQNPTITYENVNAGVPVFNKIFGSGYREYAGNYFAAFTNNAGYRNRTTIDRKKATERRPNFASVSPMAVSQPKPIGKKGKGIINSFKYVYTSGQQSLDGDIPHRKVNPYLRAMTVDRRLDYSIRLFGPVKSDFNLYPVSSFTENEAVVDKNRGWRNARVVAKLYGGIELSYDEEYNVITANTTFHKVIDEEGKETNENDYNLPPISATPSSLLEYSYEFDSSDSDSKTIYNMPDPKNVVWERDGIDVVVDAKCNEEGYIVKKYGVKLKPNRPSCVNGYIYEDDIEPIKLDDGTDMMPSINKRFYEFNYSGMDLRDYVWSYNNEVRLKKYINEGGQGGSGLEAFYNCKDKPYIFTYPTYNKTDFNGNFDRENVRNGNYPTRRYIDVGNIEPTSFGNFYLSSCAYDNHVEVNNGEIIGTTKEKTSSMIDLDIGLSTSPIQFIEFEDNNNNDGNINYKLRSGGNEETIDGTKYKAFITNDLNLAFAITPQSSNDFAIYTYLPTIIRVFPRLKDEKTGKKVDGITYLKTLTPAATKSGGKEYPEIFGKGDIFHMSYLGGDVLNNVALYYFTAKIDIAKFMEGNRTIGEVIDAILPDNCVFEYHGDIIVRHGDGTPVDANIMYNKSSNKYLTSDSTEFTSVKFIKKLQLKKDDAKVLSILVSREYVSNDSNNVNGNKKDTRIKQIITMEFSELIDCRDVFLRIDKDKSYVSYRKTDVNVEVELPEEEQEEQHANTRGDNDSNDNDKANGKGSASLYSQTITFEFCVKNNPDDPELSSCQIFNSPTIGYTFVFTNIKEKEPISYTLESSKVEKTEFGERSESFTSIGITGTKISVPITFTQEMGLLQDGTWNCYILVTDGSLKYKIGEFGIECDKNAPLPTEGNTVTTNASIKNPNK